MNNSNFYKFLFSFAIIVSLILLSAASSSAQELFLRKDKYYTELYLKLDPKNIANISRTDNQNDNNNVTISFTNLMKQPFSQSFDDDFIQNVQGSGGKFVINLKKGAEFSIVNDANGVRIVATKAKTNTDILSNYGVGGPKLSNQTNAAEDRYIQEMLDNADRHIANRQYPGAVQAYQQVIASSKNEFFRQEAMFKLGQAYMLLAQYDSSYYSTAANTFDDFAKLYPDNFRAISALLKSAEAKELSQQPFEAANTYEKIFNATQDLETKRTALLKKAEIHKKLLQPDAAINTYLSFLRNFESERDFVNSEIGNIYYGLKETNLAIEYFAEMNLDKLINSPDLTVERLDAIADTFYIKNRLNDALKLYQALYDRFPDSPQANNAIYRVTEILGKKGNNLEADNLTLVMKEKYPDKESGQRATLEYAQKYAETKPFAYWDEFFKDLFTRPDIYGLHADAKYILIKKLYKENRIPEAIEMIDNFVGMYQKSDKLPELKGIKEDYLFSNISAAYNEKNYASLEPQIIAFKQEFPESKFIPRTDIMQNDIKFNKVQMAYNANDYKGVIASVRDHLKLDDVTRFKDKARWDNLLDNSSYKDLNITFAAQNYPAARAMAKAYLDQFPKGKFRQGAATILEKAMLKPLEDAYKAADYPTLLQLYDSNKEWINRWPNKKFVDSIKTMIAMSVYRLGSPTKAKVLYSEITPDSKNRDYTILGLLLADKNLKVDINSFDEETFKYIIGELEPVDLDLAIYLLDSYSRNQKYATELKYSLAKNISSDIKRQQVLNTLYEKVRNDPNSRFQNYENIYMDVGMVLFRRNDFKNAVIPLKDFLDIYRAKDDKRAEALYYMGKSFVSIGDTQKGYQYYNELANSIPNSIYSGIAKGEIDQINWRKDLNKK